jgi:endo-1,4-beta-D-glucanase Y
MRNRRSPSVAVKSPNLALRSALSLGLFAAGAAAGVLVSADAHAQAARFPFPSSNTTGLKSQVLTVHELRAQYDDWKAAFVEDCQTNPSSMRVHYPENPGNDTRSEGIGYGMVIAAYMGDKATFDGLLGFWQRFDNNNLMTWKINGCQGGADNGSASDADVDAAMGLIIAERQWGGYADAARAVLQGIQSQEILGCAGGRNLLDPGSVQGFGSCSCLNPSYFAPGYYSVFAGVDTANAGAWNGMVGAAYGTLNDAQNRNPNVGLVPAWSNSAGQDASACSFQVAGGGNPGEYQSDAARVPWRVATDLAWTGSAAAQTFLGRINTWLRTQRITHIVDRYQIGGAALPTFDPNAPNNTPLNNATLSADGRRSTITMGAFAAGAVGSSQDQLDNFVGAWQSLYTAGDSLGVGGAVQRHAFNSSLALLYGMLATGTMWNPAGANPQPIAPPPLAPQDPANKIENGDFDEGLRGWKFVNIGGAGGAEGFAMHKGGELNIVLQKAAPDADNAYQVRLSQVVDVVTGRNYRIAFRAKASAARPIKVAVQFGGEPGVPYEGFGALGNQRDAEAPVTLGADYQNYEWVFTSAGTRQNANFDIDVADSLATLIIDDVFFGETTLPPSVAGEGPAEDPTTPPPGGGTTPPPGGGTTPPANGPGGPVQVPGQDLGSTPNGTPGANPGGGTIDGALAPIPTGSLSGTGMCTTDADCRDVAKYGCSKELHICFDRNTGYVWNPNTNNGAGGWQQPPQKFDRDGDGELDDDCGTGRVWWPKQNGCYDPVSGYAYDEQNMRWVYIGDGYTLGQDGDGGSDSSCSVGQAPGAPRSVPWLLAGVVLGAGMSFGYRRRSRAAR